MSPEILADPAVERAESVGWCESTFKQQSHWVAFVAKGRLDPDKNIAELRAEHLNVPAIALDFSWRWTPLGFDLRKICLASDVLVRRNPGRYVGISSKPFRIPFEQRIAKPIDALGHVNRIAFGREPLERRMQRFKHREKRSGARGSCIGRKVEEHDGELALRAFCPAQCDQFSGSVCQRFGALGTALHRANLGSTRALAMAFTTRARFPGGPRSAAEDSRIRGTIEFRQRDHHGRFERQQALLAPPPLPDCLEFDRVRREVWQIELA